MNLYYVIFAIVGIFVVHAAIINRSAFKKLTYQRHFNKKTCYAGDEFEIVELIGNRKVLPLPWVKVESQLPPEFDFEQNKDIEISAATQHKSFFYLGMFKSIRRHHKVTCSKRGYYRINNVHITTGDLLGFITKSKSYEIDSTLLVFPRHDQSFEPVLPSIKWQGDLVVKRWILEDRFLVSGIREYEPYDSMRDIHWKASARMNQLHVKTNDHTAFSRLIIYLNLQTHEDQWDQPNAASKEQLEKAISYIAYMSNWALAQGIEVGFYCNGYLHPDKDKEVRIPPQAGMHRRELILEALARLELHRVKTLQSMLEQDVSSGLKGVDMLIISFYWSDLLEAQTQRLRQNGNNVLQIAGF